MYKFGHRVTTNELTLFFNKARCHDSESMNCTMKSINSFADRRHTFPVSIRTYQHQNK